MLKTKINLLFLFQIITHVSVIFMIYYGSFYHYVISFLIYFLTGCVGMSGTYHRLLSHKSYDPPTWFEYIGTFLGTIGGTGSSIAWCSVHREHHRFTDTIKDPHSPLFHSMFSIHFQSMFHKPNIKYVPDLLRNKFHKAMHEYYWGVHIAYAIICFLIDPFSIVYAYLFPSFILWHAGSSINSLSHMFGKKENLYKDHSTNHWLTGFLVWGEGWHSNHHKEPGNYRFGKSLRQFDCTAYLIESVCKLK